MNTAIRKRKRRMASDEAHAWARSLQLKNPHAKSVLRALALYVNAEGACFVGLEALCDDCDLTENTVRNRLNWLEEIGAIARYPVWMDGHGRRTRDPESRGKRTTDDIVLLLEADIDLIEARARGEDVDDDDDSPSRGEGLPGQASPAPHEGLAAESSPSPREGLAQGQPRSSPALAPQYAAGPNPLNHEPEQSPPSPPPGVELNARRRELFEAFKAGYPSSGNWPWPTIEPLFAELSDADAELAARALKLWVAEIARAKIAAMNPRRFLNNRIFANYAAAPEPTKQPERVLIEYDTAEWRAACVARWIAMDDMPMPSGELPGRGMRGYLHNGPLPADLVALAQFYDDRRRNKDWPIYQVGSQEFAAWRDRLERWGFKVALHSRFVDGQRLVGLPAPCAWPPRKDGVVAQGSDNAANDGR
jgi:hypothetical protein